MKILFIQPTGDKRGHYGCWTSKLCQAIAKRGDELYLFTNKIYPEKFLNELPQFKIIELANGKYCFDRYNQAMENKSLLYWYGYFRTTYLIVKYALKLCQFGKFDVVFITDAEYLTATLLLKWYKRYLPPVIWHVQAANFSHDSYCGSFLKKSYKLFQRAIFKSTLNREVNAFAVLGEFHKQELREQLNLGEEFSIEVICDGADVPDAYFDKADCLKNIGIDYTGTVFLFLGMLRKDKGIEYLIEAASQLKEYDCKVIIAGASVDWTLEELKALVKRYDVANHVELRVGYVPDHQISSYYYASDVIIFPYDKNYTGGCGPLTKGASTHGKPVIVTDVADIGRMVRQYSNGLIAEPCHAESLAAQMISFINLSLEDRQILAKNAQNLAKKHSWGQVATQLVQFLGGVSENANVK